MCTSEFCVTVTIQALLLQITDFGLSITKAGVGHDNMMQDFCGTPNYMGKTQYYMCKTLLYG